MVKDGGGGGVKGQIQKLSVFRRTQFFSHIVDRVKSGSTLYRLQISNLRGT